MVESVASSTASAPSPVAKPKPQLAANGRPQQYYPDGSAVPDVIAFYNRPEDLNIEGTLNLPQANPPDSGFFGKDGLTFGDFLDIVNPLQHIPVISTIYRAITGDEISPGSRIAGGALYGGPLGAGLSIINAMVEESTGKDVGATVLAAITDEFETSGGTAVATAKTATPAATQAASPAGTESVAPAATASASPVVAAAAEAPAKEAVASADPGTAPDGSRFFPVHQTSAHPVHTAINRAALNRKALSRAGEPEPVAALPFASGMPFGGMGALPFTRAPGEKESPAAAVLQARAAVPQTGGPIPGLGAMASAQAKQEQAIPKVSQRLADKLAALAARTPPVAPETAKADKPAQDASGKDAASTETASAKPGFYVPPGLIPQTMMSNLERYQHMKQAEEKGVSG